MTRTMTAAAGAALLLASGCRDQSVTPTACGPSCQKEPDVRLITVAPGHFHAALIQKRMYPEVSPRVHIYAPEGNDLRLHLARIESFNARADDPTSWESVVYTGPDFLERAIADRAGNVVVLAGNNARKTEYILKFIEAGFHVLADKPMAITPEDFDLLKRAFEIAQRNNLFLYDIMTQRYEITSILQNKLSRFPDLFGQQETGSPDDPAVVKESTHHFSKVVAGRPLQRPSWFYDTRQQGEAIMDITTHLTDLVQWGRFPGQILSTNDVRMVRARTWATPLTLAQFTASTAVAQWPEYLLQDLDAHGVLQCKANGEFVYALRGVYVRIAAMWNYEAPPGAGDTHHSLVRGTRASLIIDQGEAEGYKPVLYVEPRRLPGVRREEVEAALKAALAEINKTYPGVGYEAIESGWRITIPEQFSKGHEAHFGQVAGKYLGFLKQGAMPDWEVPNMLVKHHTLMEAYRMSR